MSYGPKLIEVALPLAAINRAAAREKSLRHGHPSTLHLWWARRPLAAIRAVLWASLVDDPSGDQTLTAEQADAERARLFGILERLVVWENTNDERVLGEARAEIAHCNPGPPPPILDPFGGGGAVALEAQRLGLEVLSGDLNPVAVLILKATVEIPPRFAGRPPAHSSLRSGPAASTWTRAQGLAADVNAYGISMMEDARRRIGANYEVARPPPGEEGSPLEGIAWIWARTIRSPDPAWRGDHVPLVSSWVLANKKGKAKVWVEPIVDESVRTICYCVREGGEPTAGPTMVRGLGAAKCLTTGSAIPNSYIRAEATAGRLGTALLAVVAKGPSGRVYLSPTAADIEAAKVEPPAWRPEGPLPNRAQGIRAQLYGMDEWWKLFTARQLVAMTTFSDLLGEAHQRVAKDALGAGFADDGVRLRHGGAGATAYADAVVTYLAFVVDKCADRSSTICTWDTSRTMIRNTFTGHRIAMTWDFAEANPFSGSTGSWTSMLTWVRKAIEHLPAEGTAEIRQEDARVRVRSHPGTVISTDPPYYDNVGFADLSDFFYVWLRRNLSDVWPDEFATLLTPKTDEMIAAPYRHGGRAGAEEHFETGVAEFMSTVASAQATSAPATIYYAYKATETRDGDTRSPGWDTFLQAVVDAGLQVTATWPLRTELANRLNAIGTNSLASSIVIACRPRGANARPASTGDLLSALRSELPEAVRVLQSGNIAPVDMTQSTIGPGIAIFSRYSKVVKADGSPMAVSEALGQVNDILGEILDGSEADLDPDTRFALAWYSLHGYNPGTSGDAITVARSKGTTLDGVLTAGIAEAGGGRLRLLERSELDTDWTPETDARLTAWEATQHLVAALYRSQTEAAGLLHRIERHSGNPQSARDLAYILFDKASEQGWAEEADAYNTLIAAWQTLRETRAPTDQQLSLD